MDNKEISASISEVGKQLHKADELVVDQLDPHDRSSYLRMESLSIIPFDLPCEN